MPDLELLLEIILDFVADNSLQFTVGPILFGVICLVLFRRHKYLRPYFIVVMVAGPALVFYADHYFGDSVKTSLSAIELRQLVKKAEYDFDVFKRNMDMAVKAGKVRRNAADTYLRHAKRYRRDFLEKLNSVPRAQRKKFMELRKQFREEIDRAEESLGEVEIE